MVPHPLLRYGGGCSGGGSGGTPRHQGSLLMVNYKCRWEGGSVPAGAGSNVRWAVYGWERVLPSFHKHVRELDVGPMMSRRNVKPHVSINW